MTVFAEHAHDVARVDVDRREETPDLVREGDLHRVVRVARVLERLGSFDRKRVDRLLDRREHVLHERERPVVPDAGGRERRVEEVGDAASFAQELGDHADAERVVGLAPRRLLEDRAHAAVDRSRGDGAAVEDRDERRPARDDGPELLGDPLDEAEVDGSVAPGRRADGHEDDVGVGGRSREIG